MTIQRDTSIASTGIAVQRGGNWHIITAIRIYWTADGPDLAGTDQVTGPGITGTIDSVDSDWGLPGGSVDPIVAVQLDNPPPSGVFANMLRVDLNGGVVVTPPHNAPRFTATGGGGQNNHPFSFSLIHFCDSPVFPCSMIGATDPTMEGSLVRGTGPANAPEGWGVLVDADNGNPVFIPLPAVLARLGGVL